MDLEIDTESADAAVLQLFARREPETMEVVVVGTSVSSRPPKHDNSEDGDDNISEDVQDASNKVSTSYSTAKWRNGTRCIAKGCTNRATDMLNWREELCEHGKRQAICKKCRITQPYRLHYVNRSNHQLTMLFAELLLSKTAYKKINDSACLPAYHWRICSDHFHVSQLGNPMAFPVLGIGKTHAQIREISRRHGVEDQLPANFDEISLECQRLIPCFSLTRNIPSTVSCSSTPDNISNEWDDSNESIKRYYEWSSRGQRQSNETEVKGQTDSDEDSKTGDGIDKDEVMLLKGGGRSLIDEDEVRGRAEHQHRVRGPRLGRRNLRRRTVQVGKNLVTSESNKNEMSDSEEMKSQLTKQNKPQQKRENLCQDETVSKVRSKKRGRKRGRADLGDSHRSVETGASKKHKRTANEKNAQHNYDRTVTPCAVSGCRAHVGDNIAEECSRTMRFFGLPPSYEAATAWIYACKREQSYRQYWMRRVKCVFNSAKKRAFRSLVNFIVCEQHFVDGRPTSLNPNPTLRIPSLAQKNKTDAESPYCIIAGCNIKSGMRNAKSLNENDYELYLLPNDVVERGKWLAAIRKGRPDFTIPSVPSLSTRNKFYVCERHFSTKKFDIPVKRLMPNDNENSSSNTETSDSDSDEEIIPEETTLTAEQKEKYRSLMTIVLERRPMFKCLVRCCPITNHLVKPDQLRPYTFFELPRIPTVRAHWLDALYLSDSAFEFPPPLIGCGKYAVCERHFCVGKLNASTSRKVPFSVIPTVNLTPQSARNIQLDAKLPPSQTTALRMKAISRCMNNHSDQQLKREMRALFTRWCCREVPEIHKIIARLSCKIDRLHDLVVRLCGVYGVEPVFPAEFDALEDDRVYGRNAVVGSLMPNASEALQLEKALEGLIAITANVTTDNKSQAAEKSVEIDERNDEVSNDDGEVRFEGMSHLEKQIVTMNNEGDVLKTSESVHSQSSAGRSLSPNSATGRVGATFDDSITADWSGGVSGESSVDKLEDIIILRDSSDEEGDGIEQHSSNQYCTNDSTNEQEKSENSSGGDVSADDDEKDEADATSGCDELTSEWNIVQSRTERQESINGTDMNGGATIGAEDEIAPSLSPHVEDGPPLLFTEADQLP